MQVFASRTSITSWKGPKVSSNANLAKFPSFGLLETSLWKRSSKARREKASFLSPTFDRPSTTPVKYTSCGLVRIGKAAPC